MEGAFLRQLGLREVTVRIVILLGLLCFALFVLVESVNRVGSAEVAAAAVKSVIYRLYGGEAPCPKCSEYRDIGRIEFKKSGFAGIWKEKVYVNCPEHGYILSAVSEWHVPDDSVERGW